MIANNYPLKIANLSPTSTAVFVQYYNKNIPDAFPRATLKALENFQILHPSLFTKSHKWIIEKHRKKFMDWLPSYIRSLPSLLPS